MRPFHGLPLAAAILLAACQTLPGQYRTTHELIEFALPGVPELAKEQLRSVVVGELAKGHEFCLTPVEAAINGRKHMLENLAEADCTFSRFDVADGTIDAVMRCEYKSGLVSEIAMSGQMTPESSDMTMAMDQQIDGAGLVHMTLRVESERIGGCA